MKKLVLTALVAAALMTSCSKDDGPKCESCTSELGNKFEICDNGDGTYDATSGGVTETITEGELEGFTPKQDVELSCALDSGQDL
ncbi:hypothetical protein PY092_01630 [Muricauda sp. 334s03]|uniref:Uncharacterized protein n=1 Tax=Flagellimonas yonaguniensis TaxID=3031325 RepID=A0ABT5XUH4_9FLAO|nr:hypothetical protein [[Muricauda] yonaguniensis]MDF0714834.1 hypothetical protein [[Muricauda] yonaguniensis]